MWHFAQWPSFWRIFLFPWRDSYICSATNRECLQQKMRNAATEYEECENNVCGVYAECMRNVSGMRHRSTPYGTWVMASFSFSNKSNASLLPCKAEQKGASRNVVASAICFPCVCVFVCLCVCVLYVCVFVCTCARVCI